MKKITGSILVMLSVVVLYSVRVEAAFIKATAYDKDKKASTIYSGPLNDVAALNNGDFEIFGDGWGPVGTGRVLGDGVDEGTRWTFKFTDEGPLITYPFAELVTATLRLWLMPKDSLITTDGITVDGLGDIALPERDTIEVGTLYDVSIDLLAPGRYNAADLINLYNTSLGLIPMLYADDAIITKARLTLSDSRDIVGVPEPATLLLLGSGLLGLVGMRKRCKT